MRCVAVAAVVIALSACGSGADTPPPLDGAARFGTRTNADAAPPAVPFDSATPRIVARAVASWPHDSTAYTQGLLVDGSRVIEGTGLVGQSDVREVEVRTGRVLRRTPLATQAFGEGTAVVGDRLYQLTWQGGRGYVYDATTLSLADSVTYAGEGWGLTSDGTRLYLSDGSDQVRVINASTFAVERKFNVTEAGRPVWMLNELEWVDGTLLANIYQTDLVARIDPATGRVVGWIDLGGLLTLGERASVVQRGGVANGIAHDARRARLLVTGKRWPRVFELAVPRSPAAASNRRAGRTGSQSP